MSKLVRTERIEDGRVLRVVLDAPKGNILSTAMMQAIAEALAGGAEDPRLQLVLLEGSGAHFSFGASVEEHKRDQAQGMLAQFHRFARSLAAFPVPIAALVKGQCLGGAFETVLCCHFVFCTPDAKLGCPEIKLGVFPPVLACVGPLRLGGATSERLLLTGGLLSAEEAVRCGLCTRVVADEAQVIEWYREHLAPLSAFSLRQATKVARQASGMIDALKAPLERAERQYLDELLPSHDGNEGINAFLERRPPRWQER